MSKLYTPLSIGHLDAHVSYAHPPKLSEVLHWDDPALHAMVDFKYVQADIISSEDGIDIALLAIKNCHYHVLLVVNHEDKIDGIVSAEDLLGEKPLKVIQERRIPRAEISVGMVMVPQNEIIVFNVEELRHAKVSHVVEALHAHKKHFALVIKMDEKLEKQIVRGLFSISQISKQLGRDVSSDLSEAQSIAELQHGLHLHD